MPLVWAALHRLRLWGVACFLRGVPDAKRLEEPDRYQRGWPRITACLPPEGRLLVIEFPVGRKQAEGDEAIVVKELRKSGALVIRIETLADLPKIDRALDERGIRKRAGGKGAGASAR